jgi:hypothetical protein
VGTPRGTGAGVLAIVFLPDSFGANRDWDRIDLPPQSDRYRGHF